MLTQLNEPALAELIEKHIDYVDGENDRSVHLPTPFVHHFMQRRTTLCQSSRPSLHYPSCLPTELYRCKRPTPRSRHRLPCAARMLAILPTREQCTPDAIRHEFRFLTDEWLVDVATDFTGKCILIAAALALIQRSLLPDRPVFFVQRAVVAVARPPTLIMLRWRSPASTGRRRMVADEEERRKALLAYLMAGVPAIIWDNIPRGAQISCPHIERSCTTAFYSDRCLGVSELAAVAASAIHLFTGNNIGPRGDLASRALIVRLEVDRPDPENRSFVAPRPYRLDRSPSRRILKALYTLLLGNPALWPNSIPPRTRFKSWWQLVGASVEYAARLCDTELDFQSLFLEQEEEEEESASLTDALRVFTKRWPTLASMPPTSPD